MLQKRSILCIALRKYIGFLALATAAVLLAGSAAWGQHGQNVKTEPAVRLLTTIPVPTTAAAATTAGALYSFDISWIDQHSQLYYLADRFNNVIDVADAKNSTFVKQIAANPPFSFREMLCTGRYSATFANQLKKFDSSATRICSAK